jgi:hypothetical protein
MTIKQNDKHNDMNDAEFDWTKTREIPKPEDKNFNFRRFFQKKCG